MNNWYNATGKERLQGLIIEEGTGRNVAISYDPKDAKLIAAAPELLDALIRVFNHLLMSQGNFVMDGRVMTSTDWKEAAMQAREAIQKATDEE